MEAFVSEKEAAERVEKMWEVLKNRRRHIPFSPSWKVNFPNEPGVYVAWERESTGPAYFGETGNLFKRMGDLERTINHTLRRSIGNTNFSNVEGFVKATSKKKFPDHIERLVDKYMKDNLEIAFIAVYFGRKEFEEAMIEKFKSKYNPKGKRK